MFCKVCFVQNCVSTALYFPMASEYKRGLTIFEAKFKTRYDGGRTDDGQTLGNSSNE